MHSSKRWKILVGHWTNQTWYTNGWPQQKLLKVWFSCSHNCTMANGAFCLPSVIFQCHTRMCDVTFSYCAWLWDWDMMCLTAISWPRASELLTAHARWKRRALERTGSNSPQIADLLYCITFQITNQHHLRVGPFQSLRFRRTCAVRS